MVIYKQLNEKDAEHAVFCGKCIEVVYNMYYSDPHNLTPRSGFCPRAINSPPG